MKADRVMEPGSAAKVPAPVWPAKYLSNHRLTWPSWASSACGSTSTSPARPVPGLLPPIRAPSPCPPSSARLTRPMTCSAASRRPTPGGCWWPGTAKAGCTRCWSQNRCHRTPRGFALIAPQDARLLPLIGLQTDEQINAAVSQGLLTAAGARSNAKGVQQAIAEFRAGQPVTTTGLSPDVVQLLAPELLSPANARYVRSDDAIYPPSVAARLPSGTRVLVTDGTQDTNVPLSTIKPLVSALAAAGTSGPGLQVLNGVNHLLHRPGVPENDQVLAPSAVAALRAWAQPYAS